MIETDRLCIRLWQESDAPALFKYASEPRVSERALWPCHTSVDMSRWVIENVFVPNPHSYAMVLKETDEPVGAIGLVPAGDEHFAPLPNEREVGYWIGLPHWGRGLTPEALRSFSEFCRTELRLDSLLLTTAADNIASQRVAGKCGFSFVADYSFDGVPSKAYRRTLCSLVSRDATDDAGRPFPILHL